jgi:hypothetical protein
MWIEDFFNHSLNRDLPYAWHWLYETGRCRVSSKKFWDLMIQLTYYLDLKDERELIKREVLDENKQ